MWVKQTPIPALITGFGVQKEMKPTQKQPSYEKWVQLGEKSCEIKGGSQEMVAMMLMLIDYVV